MSIAQANTEDMQTYRTVTLLLRDMQMPPHIKGYGYIREALMLILNEPDVLSGITTRLYPFIAEKFHTTPSRVERSMRHCLENTLHFGDQEVLERVLGKHSRRIASTRFLATVAEYLKLEGKA